MKRVIKLLLCCYAKVDTVLWREPRLGRSKKKGHCPAFGYVLGKYDTLSHMKLLCGSSQEDGRVVKVEDSGMSEKNKMSSHYYCLYTCFPKANVLKDRGAACHAIGR